MNLGILVFVIVLIIVIVFAIKGSSSTKMSFCPKIETSEIDKLNSVCASLINSTSVPSSASDYTEINCCPDGTYCENEKSYVRSLTVEVKCDIFGP